MTDADRERKRQLAAEAARRIDQLTERPRAQREAVAASER
jgi:hypothetical protein